MREERERCEAAMKSPVDSAERQKNPEPLQADLRISCRFQNAETGSSTTYHS